MIVAGCLLLWPNNRQPITNNSQYAYCKEWSIITDAQYLDNSFL